MTIQEAYAAIDAVAKPDQAVFITTCCRWYDHVNRPGNPIIEFQVSLVPGFNSECDQWNSAISLANVVRECVESAAGATPASIETANELFEEASDLATTPTA